MSDVDEDYELRLCAVCRQDECADAMACLRKFVDQKMPGATIVCARRQKPPPKQGEP